MTEKKAKILEVALNMFAHNGYVNTSTSKIAKKAGVSEALIFRHFGTKVQLLDAIVEAGFEQASGKYASVVNASNPKDKIRSYLEYSLYMLQEQSAFWRLQFSLRFQSPEIATRFKMNKRRNMAMQALNQAFAELGYQEPEKETQLLTIILNGLFTYLQERSEEEQLAFINFTKKKYDLLENE